MDGCQPAPTQRTLERRQDLTDSVSIHIADNGRMNGSRCCVTVDLLQPTIENDNLVALDRHAMEMENLVLGSVGPVPLELPVKKRDR